MQGTEEYVNERLDHLGIVAGVCQEIRLAAWLDGQAPDRRQQVSVGTATVAMVLNGLGFSNRQLYLVPQYIAASLPAGTFPGTYSSTITLAIASGPDVPPEQGNNYCEVIACNPNVLSNLTDIYL